MSEFNLYLVMDDLATTQVEKQLPALEQAAEIVNSLAIKAVDALRKGPNRFLIAERLNSFGSVIVPHLEKLLKESDNSETRILAALVLLQFDSRLGVPCLLGAVTKDEDYAGLAARHLAQAGIKEAIEPIINRLGSCELKQVDLVVSLLDALAKLGGEIPSNLHQCLAASETPWQICATYTKNFASLSNSEVRTLNPYQQNQFKSKSKNIISLKWPSASEQEQVANKKTSLLPVA